MFWAFYIIGGVVGTVFHLRFSLPAVYIDLRNAWGIFDIVKTLGFHIIRVTLLGCVVFFLSWISVGYFIIHYDDFKNELENAGLAFKDG